MEDVIKKYVERFGDDEVVVLGDYAIHLMVKNTFGMECKYDNILLHVKTKNSPEVVVDRILSYMHDYDEVPPISSSTVLRSKRECDPLVTVIVNKYSKIQKICVEGIYVQHPDTLAKKNTEKR